MYNSGDLRQMKVEFKAMVEAEKRLERAEEEAEKAGQARVEAEGKKRAAEEARREEQRLRLSYAREAQISNWVLKRLSGELAGLGGGRFRFGVRFCGNVGFCRGGGAGLAGGFAGEEIQDSR